MTKLRYIVGIDPDLRKPGLAAWDYQKAEYILHKTVNNEDVVEALQDIPADQTIIYLEAGWLNKKSNWRPYKDVIAQRIAKNVGQNHAVGQMLSAILTKQGYTVKEIAPLPKGILKGRKGWTPTGKRYIMEATGITSRMNDEVRDALYIVARSK